MDVMFENKSKYIEWLIYQDLLKNGQDVQMHREKIII